MNEGSSQSATGIDPNQSLLPKPRRVATSMLNSGDTRTQVVGAFEYRDPYAHVRPQHNIDMFGDNVYPMENQIPSWEQVLQDKRDRTIQDLLGKLTPTVTSKNDTPALTEDLSSISDQASVRDNISESGDSDDYFNSNNWDF